MSNKYLMMENRIRMEKQNKRDDQVTELILDNCCASQIIGLTDEFVNLEALSIISVGLITLDGFPKLPNLKKLELSDNKLMTGLNLLHGSPKLQHLNMSGNCIRDLEALEPLKEFHDMVNLDLYNCEVTETDDYRQKVFNLLPNLCSLDGYDRNETEVADSDVSVNESPKVENRIIHEVNELDDDDDIDEDSSDYDDSSYYDDGEEFSRITIEYGSEDEKVEEGEDEVDDFEGEEDSDNYKNDEDSINRSGRVAIGQNLEFGEVVVGSLNASSADPNEENEFENMQVGEDGDAVEDGEIIDEDEEEEVEVGGEERSNSKQLQTDIEGEHSDDNDFEPSRELDEKGREIDSEDDADEDESNTNLSASILNDTVIVSAELKESKVRGQKRKYEDESGGSEGVDTKVEDDVIDGKSSDEIFHVEVNNDGKINDEIIDEKVNDQVIDGKVNDEKIDEKVCDAVEDKAEEVFEKNS